MPQPTNPSPKPVRDTAPQRAAQRDTKSSGKLAGLVLMALIVLVIGGGIAAVVYLNQPPRRKSLTDELNGPKEGPPISPEGQAVVAKLIGRWQRIGDPYILQIDAGAKDGMLDAHYFNPNSIHVAIARVQDKEKGPPEIYIELRDVNYPGSSYTLYYNAKTDTLYGQYHQALTNETYAINFERIETTPPSAAPAAKPAAK